MFFGKNKEIVADILIDMHNIDEIVKIIQPLETRIADPNRFVSSLVYDSRKIYRAHEGIFFALQNIRDGHDFVESAYINGVRNFVISRNDLDYSAYPKANFLRVDNVLHSLQKLSKNIRSEFLGDLIGITGSNGKTIVKEWLYELLITEHKVYKSPKSYNSQLGVALSLWELNNQYNLALIEAGISQVGEMVWLEKMIQPKIGIVTGIGPAHAIGFESKDRKIAEKLSLFVNAEVVIYPSDSFELNDYLPGKKKFTWGTNIKDDIRIQHITKINKNTTRVSLLSKGNNYEWDLPFIDDASIRNILTCITFMVYYGLSMQVIINRTARLKHIEMRLQLKNGVNNCSIIDDSYSNDLGSLKIALDFLHQQKQYDKKTLILSDMIGLSQSKNLVNKLIKLLSEQDLYRLIVVGGEFKKILRDLPYPVFYFKNTQQVLNELELLGFEKETLLIKGGRAFQFEKLSRALVEKVHSTTLEIDLNAMEANLKTYKKKLPEGVKVMAMVKALSYGSGGYEVANLLQFNNVDYLTVAYADEGVELRRRGINIPIMVMNPEPQNFDVLIEYKLEPEVYSFGLLKSLIQYLKNEENLSILPIHLKLDTGMHRLGFLPSDLYPLLDLLATNHCVKVKSVFSHLVASGNPKFDVYTKQQIDIFSEFAKQLEDNLMYNVIKHISNTAAINRWPAAYFDMVRLGIGLYGQDNSDQHPQLNQVSTLKTTVTQIKHLQKGMTIGYDRSQTLVRDAVIATVRIGYADGYDRRFGQGVGTMLIHGQKVHTVGNICMDMCMLDVTGIDVEEGDEVTVFANLEQEANKIGTIPYELLVSISSRVKRVYFYE